MRITWKELTVEPTDLLVHCSMFGQIGRQIQDLPEGTKIDRFTVDGFTTPNEDG